MAAGADVNAKENLRGTTALMWAAEQRHSVAVKMLLEVGADYSARSGPAGLPRNYMAPRVNTANVRDAARRHAAAAAAGRTYNEQLEYEVAQGSKVSLGIRPAADPPSKARQRAGAGGACRRCAGRTDRRQRRCDRRRPGGKRRRRAHAARVRGARRRPGICESAARRRRGRQPDDRVRLDAAADGDQQPALQACALSDRARRQPEHRQQRRLDAALSRDRQPQYRRWRLSGAEAGYGPPGVHQGPARARCRPRCACEREHADPDDLHDAVVLRGGRDAVHPRRAVERHSPDAAAARLRRRPVRVHRQRRHGAHRVRRHRVGGRRHLRALA